jgi:hypothetical protein
VLADRWEARAFRRSVDHVEHVRIARVLVRRYGRREATRRLVNGTRANCEAVGVADRFDGALTTRWSDRIADAVEQEDATSFEKFVTLHPELLRGDLLGLPQWRKSGY